MAKKKQQESLSRRLKDALKTANISSAELARRIGTNRQVIKYLCDKNAKKSKFTYEIAEALGVDSTWLATGGGKMIPELDPQTKLINRQKRIPIFNSEQIKEYIILQIKPDLSLHEDWVLSDVKTSDESFAFLLNNKSMYPRFDTNTTIIIDPKKTPKSKNFTLVYIEHIDEIIFREIVYKNNSKILNPINTVMFNPVKLQDNDRILGVMVEARWQY